MKKGESISYFYLNIGQNYLIDWNASLAIREIIANALDEKGEGNIEVKAIDEYSKLVKHYGCGLKLEHFIFQKFEKRKRSDKIYSLHKSKVSLIIIDYIESYL